MISSISRMSPKFTGKEEVVVLPLNEKDVQLKGPARKLDVLSRSTISKYLKNGRFSGKLGETALIGLDHPKAPDHVLLLGLGKRNAASAETMTHAGGGASKTLKSGAFKQCHLLLGDSFDGDAIDEFLPSFLKGFLLAQYEFSIKQKKSRASGLRKLVILSDEASKTTRAVRRAKIIAQSAKLVRDLVNYPANYLTPTRMADEARALASETGIHCKVHGPKQLSDMGMGAIIAVAKGSHEEPRLITLHYNKGKKNMPRVCLVGKGVTFDSGGISIKPWLHMEEMKGDMAGSAVVLNTIAAAARLKLPIEIIALLPCVENLPDGIAFKPGDVITTYSGKTIEILSTDAEGRLILSDCLSYGQEFKPDFIMDLATLTGAIVIALGTRIAGAFGNNQAYMDKLVAAGKTTGEPVWQMPLDDTFSKAVRGDISDYKNFSGRNGSAITAAALLGEFVGKVPWIHLDIAGTFWSDGGGAPHHTKGGTGYGVDLMIRFLENIIAEAK